MKDICFNNFSTPIIQKDNVLLNNPFEVNIPEIAKVAAKELQQFIELNKYNWPFAFGLQKEGDQPTKGKMFGVLVVKTKEDEMGYISAFSGKIADKGQPDGFVPPLFDISKNDSFLTTGMTDLTRIGSEISNLQKLDREKNETKIEALKEERSMKSNGLQHKLFDCYHFLNKRRESKSLVNIFEEYANRKPSGGAGDCAAPKLFQHAFKNDLKPIAIAEFWWGKSTPSKGRIHGEYYPACEDKCRPILSYMLDI